MKIIKINMAILTIMVMLSLTNLFGLSLAGVTVIIGIVFFFIDKGKKPFSGSGLDVSQIGAAFADKKIIPWMAAPLVMDALAIALAWLILPEYLDHLFTRTSGILSFDKVVVLFVQLVIFAIGEEIAWRAFFQRQMEKVIPITAAIAVSSVLFGLGHIAEGSTAIVVYDIFFVMVNACLYGIIYHKTQNAWMSAISHFAANLSSIVILLCQ